MLFHRRRNFLNLAPVLLGWLSAVAVAQPGPAQFQVPGLAQQQGPAAGTPPQGAYPAWPGGFNNPAGAMPYGAGMTPYGQVFQPPYPAQVPGQGQMQNQAQGQMPGHMPGQMQGQMQGQGQHPAGSMQMPSQPQAPKGPTHLIDLPRMDNRAIGELIAGLVTRFELELGYATANDVVARQLAVPAKIVPSGAVISRVDANKKLHLMRFGFLRQPGQLPQLWASGMIAPDPASMNPDIAQVEPSVAAILSSRDKSEADLAITELRAKVINLAYADADGAAGMLKGMGFNVSSIDRAGAAGQQAGGYGAGTVSTGFGGSTQSLQPTYGGWGATQTPGMGQATVAAPQGVRRVRNSELPMVLRMPTPNAQDVGLVGAAADGTSVAAGTGQNGVTSILGASGRFSQETLSSPTTQLMVLYNADRPEQLALVTKALKESIDTPARQILIEAMVLEVTGSGLRELGVQWNYEKNFNSIRFGSLTPGSGDTVNYAHDTAALRGDILPSLVKTFFVKLQALVQSGRAEVLARPSVLTLDNRQASIRVGTDIPIATSRDASSGTESRVSYSFFYLPTGIQLNVRPRIDNDGAEVSLQIDAAVSTTVANLGTQIRSPGDVVLAAAPAVSTRRVQTYARIPNSTPLIIGGLISRTRDQVADSVPGIGEIPLLGNIFGAKKSTSSRDEVIIVLTPYVLEQGKSGLEAAMPKDAPAFEYSRENELFRKNVRLSAEDVLNLAYIRENARLLRYRELVNRIAAGDPSRVEKTPLAKIVGNRTPGEKTLMAGMLFNLLRKRSEGDPISGSRMQIFMERDKGEVVVKSLDEVLAMMGDGSSPESFFNKNPSECLAITFVSHRQEMVAGNVLSEPEPKTRVVDCKSDRSDWGRLLYELNKNTVADEFNTILIRDKSDLQRLSTAITLRRMIQINGGNAALDFEHLGVGRVLAIPEFGPAQSHMLDADVARFFYLSQHYYRAFEEDFEEGMSDIEKILRTGRFNDVIAADELPVPGSAMARQR
ncbi:MAG: hypothetical protein EOO28_16525 [Comamonadaceae bacterium]|nr:MAG: hypothetical protein EOO28_16525 [Comamonadaceae bacterium]